MKGEKWETPSERLAEAERPFIPQAESQTKSQQEARLILEFSHHVDESLGFLKEILMPRRL
jgi:hypothetical protein